MKSPNDALLRQMTAIDPTTDAAYVAILGSGDEERRDRRRPLQRADPTATTASSQ